MSKIPLTRIQAKEAAKAIQKSAGKAGRVISYTQALAEVAIKHGYANIHEMTASYIEDQSATAVESNKVIIASVSSGVGKSIPIRKLPHLAPDYSPLRSLIDAGLFIATDSDPWVRSALSDYFETVEVKRKVIVVDFHRTPEFDLDKVPSTEPVTFIFLNALSMKGKAISSFLDFVTTRRLNGQKTSKETSMILLGKIDNPALLQYFVVVPPQILFGLSPEDQAKYTAFHHDYELDISIENKKRTLAASIDDAKLASRPLIIERSPGSGLLMMLVDYVKEHPEAGEFIVRRAAVDVFEPVSFPDFASGEWHTRDPEWFKTVHSTKDGIIFLEQLERTIGDDIRPVTNLINNRMLNGKKIPDGWVVIATVSKLDHVQLSSIIRAYPTAHMLSF